MKKYNLKIGIPVCLLIAVMVTIARASLFVSVSEYLQITVYYFIFSLISWVGNQYFIQTEYFKKARYSKLAFFAISIFCGCLFSFLLRYSISSMDHIFIGFDNPDDTRPFLPIIFRGTLFNVLNAFLVFHLHEVREKEQSQIELSELKQAQLQANMSILKEQLSPHFLFNTFNTLTTLTREQPVIDYVEKLAEVYRYLLSHQKKDWVTLQEELQFTEAYLYIIKTRLERAIEISIAIPPEVLSSKIPPLTLQLLVENAIKHNITSTTKPLIIQLHTMDGELVVTNNLQPRNTVATSSGIGLKNISSRYRLLFDRDIRIENQHHLFQVTLPILV